MFCYLNYWQVGGQICGKWKCSVEAAHRVVGLSGHAPFESKTGNAQETYGLVKRGIETVHFPGAVNLQVGGLVPLWGESGQEFDLGVLEQEQFSVWNSHDVFILNPNYVPQTQHHDMLW